MIGLALLPFAIPLVWLIAPLIVGNVPALSLAAPLSLAASASVLCLAVVFTVDWTSATRIKGVLMLVGLSYFAGLSLYFLKEDVATRAKAAFGPDWGWQAFRPPGLEYQVRLPAKPLPEPRGQPVPGWNLNRYRAVHNGMTGTFIFVVGSGKDTEADMQADRWFDRVGKALALEGQGNPSETREEHLGIHPCREWTILLPDRTTKRLVRICRVDGRIFYLSAEGPNLASNDELAGLFFDSFRATTKE